MRIPAKTATYSSGVKAIGDVATIPLFDQGNGVKSTIESAD